MLLRRPRLGASASPDVCDTGIAKLAMRHRLTCKHSWNGNGSIRPGVPAVVAMTAPSAPADLTASNIPRPVPASSTVMTSLPLDSVDTYLREAGAVLPAPHAATLQSHHLRALEPGHAAPTALMTLSGGIVGILIDMALAGAAGLL